MHSLAGLDYHERGAGEVVCLVHAGVFGAWFAPLFQQPALDGFRISDFVSQPAATPSEPHQPQMPLALQRHMMP